MKICRPGMFPSIINFLEVDYLPCVVSSSVTKSPQNLTERSIILRFNIETPGNTFPAWSVMNLLCRSICGTPSRNIIARVLSKSKFLMSQTQRKHGGTLM